MVKKAQILKKSKVQFREKKRSRKKIILLTIILVLLLIVCGQYVITKLQMATYDVRDYACVHMSHDMEEFFESLGFNTVQRRVQYEHRWIAIEVLPGCYVEYESTLRLFFNHIVTEDMIDKPIYQSEGFYKDGEEIVHVNNHDDMHFKLKDWEKIGTEEGPANEDFWMNLP